MSNQNVPLNFAIIITAHNRKEYLINAINSVLPFRNQGKNLEIIVVKNYQDIKIDEYIIKNNIINIITDKNALGSKILLGLSKTSAEVIMFLEDDDYFESSKFDYVSNLFVNNSNLIYYHNSLIPIDKNGEPLKKWFKQENRRIKVSSNGNVKDLRRLIRYGRHNLSAITIRANLLRKQGFLISNYTYSLDYAVLFIALAYGGEVISDEKLLTFYRVHNSTSYYDSADINTLSNYMRDCYADIISIYDSIQKKATMNPNVYNFINRFKYGAIISKSFYNGDRSLNPLDFFEYVKYTTTLSESILDFIKWSLLIFPKNIRLKILLIIRDRLIHRN